MKALFRILFLGFLALVHPPWMSAGNLEPDSIAIGNKLAKITELRPRIDSMIDYARRLKLIDPGLSLKYASMAYRLAEISGFREQKLFAALEAGSRQAFRSNFKEAMKMAIEARELALQLNDKNSYAEALMLLGMIKDSQGNYSESYDLHFEALRIFESTGYQKGIVKAQNGIGSVCYYLGDYKKALLYYNRALELARKLKDTTQMAGEYSNLGVLFYERGEIEKALQFYDSAEQIHLRMGLKTRLAANNISIGYALLKLGRNEEAFKRYQEAVRLFSEFDYKHGLAISYLQMSDYFDGIGDQLNKLKYIRFSYETGKKYKLRKVIYQAAGALHKFYLKEGNIDSAYKYVLISNAEKDTIDMENSTARLSLLEMDYNYEKKQKEEKLKQQRKDFYIIIASIMIIALMIIIFLFLSRQSVKLKNARLEQKQLQDELDYKNKELAINVMNLLKKNEFLVAHTNHLIEIQKSTSDEDAKAELLRLIHSLQSGSGTDIWEEFELRFKQVHSGFYQNLLVKFSDLTSNELKLCALLKLNLSTKEICQLTGQRPASLDVARSRLRKKLQLQNPQSSLTTFLSQF